MKPAIQAGELRHRIALEAALPEAFDTVGGRDVTLKKRIDTWAAVELTGAQPHEDDGQRVTVITLDVTLRYRSDLTRDFKLIWRDQIYLIDSIAPVDTKCQWLRLSCHAEL
ncbi:MAG: phage head closure protein [Pseudomonadota bacterium]